MKSFNNYVNDTSEKYVYYTRTINEEQLLVLGGKHLDSVINKMSAYNRNIWAHKVNEAVYNITFTAEEENTAKDLFKYICEDYIIQTEKELRIYENYLNGNDFNINESLEFLHNTADKIKQTIAAGKQKVQQAVDNIKIKLKEVKQMLVDIANKAIKTVKDMANRLLQLLEKFNCTIGGLFEKMGFDMKKAEASWDDEAQVLAKDPDSVKKQDVYESIANDYVNGKNIVLENYGLSSMLITEDDLLNNNDDKNKENTANNAEGENNAEQSGTKMQQGEKKGIKEALWSAFKQLAIWATVCVVIPGFAVAAFPGTLFALLVPIVCKLAWNSYKIVKIVKKWKVLKKEWGTYGKGRKIWEGFCMVCSIVALCFNFATVFKNLGAVADQISKIGFDLFKENSGAIGVAPDALQTGFAAFIKMIKEGKFSWDDFTKGYDTLHNSFAETLHIEDASDVAGSTELKGFSIGKLLHLDKNTTDAIAKVHEYAGKGWGAMQEHLPKMPSNGVTNFVVDLASKNGEEKAKVLKGLADFLHQNGFDVQGAASAGVKAGNYGVSEILQFKGELSATDQSKIAELAGQYMSEHGFAVGKKAIFGCISLFNHGKDILGALKDMFVTIPTVETPHQNEGGFRVKLGGEKEKDNYIYEIDKDGIRNDDMSKQSSMLKEKNPEFINAINTKFKELKDTLNKAISEETDKNKQADYKKKLKAIEENIKREKVIIYYGKHIPNEEDNKNESLTTLYNEYLFESVGTGDLQNSLNEIAKYLVQNSSIPANNHDHWKNVIIGKDDIKKEELDNVVTQISNEYSKQGDNESDSKDTSTDNDRGSSQKLNLSKDDTKALIIACNALGKALSQINTDNGKDMSDDEKKKANETKNKCIETYKEVLGYLNKDDKFKEDLDKKKIDIVKFKEKQPTKETTEKALKVIGETPEETTDEKPKETPENTTADDTQKSDDKKDEIIPVLAWSPIFMIGADLAPADKSGKPRKDVYTMKHMYEYLTYYEIEGGISISRLEDFLGEEVINYSIYATYSVVPDKPFDDDTKVREESEFKPDQERDDFGKFTNKELAEIQSNPKNGKNYLKGNASKPTVAETPDEKEQLKKDTDTAKEALKKDEGLVDELKKHDGLAKKYIKGEGDKEEVDYDTLSNDLAERHMSDSGSSKKGLWATLKSWLGFGDDDDNALTELCKKIFGTNESVSLNNYINNMITEHKHMSLSDYCKK